jgi:hypothetical protein
MRYELSGGVAVDNIDGTIVITTNGGDAAVLNETAGVMLDLLLETQDVDAIVAAIVKKYDIDEQTIQTDFSDLLADLITKEILNYSDVPA